MTLAPPENPVFIETTIGAVSATLVADSTVVEVLVTMPTLVTQLQPVSYVELVAGLRGAPGPTGPAGILKVEHGGDPSVPRPAVPLVYWVGTVQPLNADPDDLLMLKEA